MIGMILTINCVESGKITYRMTSNRDRLPGTLLYHRLDIALHKIDIKPWTPIRSDQRRTACALEQ